jgi:hypothetical protein
MRKILIASVAAVLSVTASAEPQQITVSSPSVNQWVDRAGEALGNAIDGEMRSISYRGTHATGITYVGFECSEDGTPINIKTSERGGAAIDRLGRRVVERVNLHPVFAGHKQGQKFEAAILVAKDYRDLERGEKMIQERARKSREEWAARGMPNPVVALSMVSIR